MKIMFKRAAAILLSVMLIAASLNLSLIASADNGVAAYLGNVLKITDTFEYTGLKVEDIWEPSYYNGHDNSFNASSSDITEDAKVVDDPTNPNNKVLQIGTTSKVGAVSFVMKSAYIPKARKLKSFSFKIYTKGTKTDGIMLYKGDGLEYSTTDAINEAVPLCNGIGLYSNSSNGAHQMYVNGATVSYFEFKQNLTSNTWTNVDITYVYSGDRPIGITLKIGDNAAQTVNFNRNYLRAMASDKFLYGFLFADKNAALVDDVCFRYEVIESDSKQLIGDDFKARHEDTISIAVENVAVSDKKAIEAVLSEYNTLREDVKEYLSAEKAKLDALLNEIRRQISEQDLNIFKAAHSDIINKDVDSVTVDDIPAINAAKEAFLDLSIYAQQADTQISQKLDAMSRKLKGEKIDNEIIGSEHGVFFDDFEYEQGIITSDIYSTSVYSTENAPSENNTSFKGNVVNDPEDSSNKVLSLDEAIDGSFMYSLNEEYYPKDRVLNSISFKYYTKDVDYSKNIYLILYRGVGTDNIDYEVKYGFRADNATAVVVNGAVQRWVNQKLKSGWNTITVDYIHDTGRLIGWTISVENDSGVDSGTYTYVNYNGALGHMSSNGFMAGLGFSGASASLVDDLCFTFTKTDDEIAKEAADSFKTKHFEILGKTAATVTNADKANFDNAVADFNKLSSLAKSYLESEVIKFNELAQKLYPDAHSEAKKFVNTYGGILAKELTQYRNTDLTELQKAYDAYKALSDVANVLVATPYGVKIEAALKYISDNPTERVEGDFSGYYNDFEYFQNPFTNDTKDEGQYSCEFVTDPLDPENTVLFLGSKDNNKHAYFVIRDELWPKGSAQVTEFSFKVYDPKNKNNGRPIIAYNYKDSENYKHIAYQWGLIVKNGTLQWLEFSDGEQQRFKQLAIDTVVFEDWMEFKFILTDTTCTFTILTSDGALSTVIDQTAGQKVAFGFPGGYQFYIDDLKIKFVEGDFDIDEENKGINAYYGGNTFQKPNDTVLITGDNLGKNVGSAQLYQIPTAAVDVTNPQYVKETRFDSNSTDAGVVTSATPYTFDENNAINVEIVQKTATGLKFVLPESNEKAAYAVKLNTAHFDEATGNPLYESKYLYLNNPYINYYISDDGEFATQGGWIRLIGENLYIDDAHDVTVVLKSIATGECTSLDVTKLIDGDAYSVTAAVPQTTAVGEYEVFIHNGYGDNTCWSEPKVIKIKESSSKEKWRAKGTFNVKDYGAVGDSKINDTPAIIRAIDAAVQNGGGIVYFPRGQYRLISTLVVPEYISLEGEDMENTMLFWTAERWQYGEANKLISLYGNCEIKNLNLYASRSSSILVQNDCYTGNRLFNAHFGDITDRRKDNVFLEKLMIRTNPYAGYPSDGGFGYTPNGTESINKTDVINAILAESCDVGKVVLDRGGKNLQVKDVNYTIQGAKYATGGALVTTGSYINVSGFYAEEFGIQGIVRNAIVEDSTVVETANLIQGSNMYYTRIKHDRHYGNNREQWVSDGIPFYQAQKLQFIGQRPDIVGASNTDYVTYKMLEPVRVTKNSLVGMELYVADGQGFGQKRVIVANEADGTLKVDKPFTIAPNRNSKIWIFKGRSNNFFIQNEFIEGSAGSAYGTAVNSIYDGNHFTYHGGQKWTSNLTVIWYTSVVNELYEKPLYVHGEGIGGTVAGGETALEIKFNAFTAVTTAGFMGTVVKNNTFNEWYFVLRGGVKDSLRDFIAEHNSFSDSKCVTVVQTGTETSFDGFYFRNNEVETREKPYSDILLNLGNNKLGYKRFILINEGDTVFVLGDVNLDGKVSVKDSTMILYYYMEMLELNKEQLNRADVNVDGDITIKDASRIKQHILRDVPLGSDENPDDTSSDTPSGGGNSGGSSDSSGGSSDTSSDSSSSDGSLGVDYDDNNWGDDLAPEDNSSGGCSDTSSDSSSGDASLGADYGDNNWGDDLAHED